MPFRPPRARPPVVSRQRENALDKVKACAAGRADSRQNTSEALIVSSLSVPFFTNEQ